MNPTSGQGGGDDPRFEGPREPRHPQPFQNPRGFARPPTAGPGQPPPPDVRTGRGSHDQRPRPSPPGRYGTGLLAVLSVIAVLAGASFLGGGIALGGMMTGRVAADGGPDPSAGPSGEPTRETPTGAPTTAEESPPTEEPTAASTDGPTEEPSEEPVDEPTAENPISSEELINELRRDFDIDARQDITEEVCGAGGEEDPLRCTSSMDTNLVRVAAFENSGVAMIVALAMRESEENTAADVQEACHFVLLWFDHNGLDQAQRDSMAEATREIAGCS
ncbi:hypothetical protein [Nocardiopsis halotolerans]|uniref:hypothetical protein n=1 Tax=Nocardiopsis halotolerans TaxID=124252 RepID=UPI00034ACF91|nr:hypothetical protein [Nocardiopsis halotolerans]